MNKILLLLICVFSLSCTESTKKVIPNSAELDKITWEQYREWCGGQNILGDKNFEKIMGRVITWEGIIYSKKHDELTANTRGLLPKIIRVKMKDSGSIMADVTLHFKETLEDKVKPLKKGDLIKFRGEVKYHGGLEDHIMEITDIKKIVPQKKKKKKRSPK